MIRVCIWVILSLPLPCGCPSDEFPVGQCPEDHVSSVDDRDLDE